MQIVLLLALSLFPSLAAADPDPAPGPTGKAWQVAIVPISTNEAVSLDSIRLVGKGQKFTHWELAGKCARDSVFQLEQQADITCGESEEWSSQIPHRASNGFITLNLIEGEVRKRLRYLALWVSSDKTENVLQKAPAPNSIVQAYLDGRAVASIDVDSTENRKIVLRNHSPLLEALGDAEIEKVELFISSSENTFEVNLVLDKSNYREIPWELWGPKLEKPGRYEYRTTIWKAQRDYLGVLNEFELRHEPQPALQLNRVGLEFFWAYQPASSGTVYSVDGRWMPRYQFSDRWAWRLEAAGLLLKESGAGLFPAIELLTGPAYRLGKVELLAAFGMQFWFSSVSPTGLVLSSGALFHLGEGARKYLLRARGLQIRYSFLNFDESVHLFRAGLTWML